jgi:hypothetical protein
MVPLHIVDDSFNKPVVLCTECTHVQLGAFPDAEELKLYYEGAYSESRSIAELKSWYEKRALSQLDYMSQFINIKEEIRSACDLGCGYGVFLQKSSTYVQSVNGYELDPLCIEYCQKQGLNVSVIDDYYKEDIHFDLTTMSHFLEHIPNIVDLLNYLKMHTHYLFIEIPATDVNYPFANSGHVHFFSEKSISKILQSLGFKIIDVSRWGISINESFRYYHIKQFIKNCTPLYSSYKYLKKKYLTFNSYAVVNNRTGIEYRKYKVGVWISVCAESV